MNDKVVVGIHSTVDSETEGSFNRFVDGHSWISVTRDGSTQYFGLWPDGHPDVPDNANGTDIRVGREANFPATASRYYELTPDQVTTLQKELQKNVTWGYTNTCASWASETLSRVTGQRIEATEILSIETPRQLIEEIRRLERLHPTSAKDPITPQELPGISSSFLGRVISAGPADPFHRLHEQAASAVYRMEDLRGRTPDEISDRFALGAALLAAEHGFARVDHVLLNQANGRFEEGARLFVVQGDPHDPAHRRAHLQVDLALAATPAEMERRLIALQASPANDIQIEPSARRTVQQV
ncbi:MAG: hypothetical protein EOP91_10670 [Lysobacteraceae bacterium]|nr:MAG: hypothetical protein EOP91_10670 [Xanthomonadaceae bacterium]